MLIQEQAYRVIKGCGTFGRESPFICYEHILTASVDKDSVAVCCEWNDLSNIKSAKVMIIPREYLKKIITINQIPLEQIKLGDRCLSYRNTPGTIVYIDYKDDGRRMGNINIDWENGNKTHSNYLLDDCPWMQLIEWVGPSESEQVAS